MKNKLLLLLFLFSIELIQSQICDKKNVKLDHIFTVADYNTSIIEKIEGSGLTIAKSWETRHDGQGTTGNFIFFMNFYLELLGVTNPEEATTNTSAIGTNLNQRIFSTTSQNSPFGIALVQTIENLNVLPFATKKYHQSWMGEINNLQMAVSDNNKIPLIFIEPKSFENAIFENEAALTIAAKHNPFAKSYREHKNNIKNLTSVEIIISDNNTDTDVITYLKTFQNLKIKKGEKPLLILNFDHNKQKKQIDFSTELGLIINY